MSLCKHVAQNIPCPYCRIEYLEQEVQDQKRIAKNARLVIADLYAMRGEDGVTAERCLTAMNHLESI